MAVRDVYIKGRDVAALIVEESAFGTAVEPAVAQSTIINSYEMTVTDDRRVNNDARQSRFRRPRHQGRRTVEGSITSLLYPRGTDTPPDIGPLLSAGFGTETINGATDVRYTVSDSLTIPSLQILMVHPGVVSRRFTGCVVNEMTFELPNEGEPTVQFGLMASDHVFSGYTLLDGALTGGESSITVDSTDPFEVGSYIQLAGSSTNIYRVTAVTSATVLAITPAISGAVADNAVVEPANPYSDDPDTANSAGGTVVPMVGTTLDITTDSLTDVEFESATVTFSNNFQRVFPAGRRIVEDFEIGRIDLSGSLTLYGRRDFINYAVQSKNLNEDINVTFTMGDTTNGRVRLQLKEIELDFAQMQIPAGDSDEVGTFELPFYGKLDNPGTASDFAELILD